MHRQVISPRRTCRNEVVSQAPCLALAYSKCVELSRAQMGSNSVLDLVWKISSPNPLSLRLALKGDAATRSFSRRLLCSTHHSKYLSSCQARVLLQQSWPLDHPRPVKTAPKILYHDSLWSAGWFNRRANLSSIASVYRTF